jgi:pimeloyl-ACP methyl ester carboxylesterase
MSDPKTTIDSASQVPREQCRDREAVDPDDDFGFLDEFGFLEEIAGEVHLPWTGPPPVRRHAVEVAPGQSVSVIVWGNAAPRIVFMHGGGQNAHVFDTVALVLGWPALSIDLPGHGRSSPRPDRDYWETANALAVERVLAELAPAPVTVAGMSLGGLTGVRLAATRPELVRRLVVIDVTPNVRERSFVLTPEQRGIGALVSGPKVFKFDEVLAQAVAASQSGNAARLRRGLMFNARPIGDGWWTWLYDGVNRAEGAPDHRYLWEDVARTMVPTMLVRGGRSLYVHDDDVAEYRRLLPALRVEVVDGASHSVQGSRPVELARLMEDFSQDDPAGTPGGVGAR